MADVNEKGMFTYSIKLDQGENLIKLVVGDRKEYDRKR